MCSTITHMKCAFFKTNLYMCTCNDDYSFTYKRATAEYLQAVNRCIKRATAVCTLLSTSGQPLNTYKRSTAASMQPLSTPSLQAGNRCNR